MVRGGKLYTGFGGAGLEAGHIVIHPGGQLCGCGNRGCWEQYGSATALIRMAREEMEQSPDSALWQLCGGEKARVDGRIVFQAARQGDAAARRALERYLDGLSVGLINLANVLFPEVICLGGGISAADHDLLLEPLRERFLRPGGELEVIVPAAPGEEERARTLAEALSAFRLPVRVTGAEHRPEANALYGSGYMPGYLLHTMASSRGSRMPRLTLLDGDSGVALLTPEGLKRPVYHLLSLLEQLGDTVIAQGDMYLAARQSGREDIQVLLYHYDACFDTLFEGGSRVEEQAPFVELMKDHDYNREVTLSVRGMTGRFAIRKYRLTSEEYASRYRDFPLPPADRLSAETLRVLNGTLAHEMSLNLLELDGAYHLTLKLAPFEILLLCFEKL